MDTPRRTFLKAVGFAPALLIRPAGGVLWPSLLGYVFSLLARSGA